MRLVCFGDSITRAAEFPETDRWPLHLRDRLQHMGLQPRVYNRGVGGHTSAQGFDRFGEDVLPLLPGWVLVQFGFNDANVRDWSPEPRVSLNEYRRNMALLHRLITDGGGQCVFIINHLPHGVTGVQGNQRSFEENFAPYNDVLRLLAAEIEAWTIDIPAQLRKSGRGPSQLLGADGLHLSPQGNRLYGDLVFESLWSMLPEGQAQELAAARRMQAG